MTSQIAVTATRAQQQCPVMLLCHSIAGNTGRQTAREAHFIVIKAAHFLLSGHSPVFPHLGFRGIKKDHNGCLGWRGVYTSTVPMVGWILLESGETKKVQDFGSLYPQLACRRTLPLVSRTMCNNINNISNRNRNFNSNSKRISKNGSPCRRWRER